MGKNVFNIVRPYKGKTLASVGNYIVIGRDEFLRLFPEFKGEYSYKPLYRFTLIKDGNGYRPVRRTGKEGDEFERLYIQKYAGTEPAVTVKERDTIKDIKENQDYYRHKAELRGELNLADTIENRIKLEDLSELGIKILNDRDLARALKKKADENVSKLLSLGIVDAALDFVRNRLYKNLHPYSYGDPVGRGVNAVILDLNDRDLETLYNPTLNVTSPEVLRDLVYAEWAKIPELDRYTLNSPEISDSEGVDMVENPSYIDYNLEEIPLKLKDHSVNFHFPLGSKLYPLYSAKDFSVVDYSLRYMRPGLNISGITTGTPKKVAGEYTIGRGYEQGKGSYMSYYDKWDILPTGKGSDFDWITPLIDPGNINLYDRIYYDDVYFNPKELNLGYRYMIAPPKDSPYYNDHVRMKLMLNETPSEDAVLGTYWFPSILVLPDGLKDTESFSIKGDGANVYFKLGGLMNSTWDTLDMTTKAKVMKEALLKGITDIDIVKKNYDSKYLNVNMLPQVEDNFSKEQLYDLYNKVEGSTRSNNMYPSNSYGNLFVNGGKKDGDDWHEGVYLTNFGARNSYRKTTKYPLFITLTEEEYKDLKEKNMHVTFDYSKVKKDLRPIDNATTLLAVPGSFILKLHPDMQDEGSVVYFLDHTTGPDADGNYVITKLDLNTALGKLYIKWKDEQELYRKMASNPNPLGITEEEGQTEYIPLEELVVTKNLNTGELYNNYSLLTLDSNTKTSNTEPIPLIANLNYTNNNGTSEKRYIDPLGSTGTKEVLSKGESNSNGVVNGSPFGELGGIEMPARSFPEDSSMGFYYPGGYGGNYGYYGYQPSNILINWPTDYNLPDYSGEYDASHDGVPVEKLPFIENDKLNLNDLLAWILTLLNNKGYPVDGESEFTLPKRSKLITPKHTDVLLMESHVFNNKKAMGGKTNIFGPGGYVEKVEAWKTPEEKQTEYYLNQQVLNQENFMRALNNIIQQGKSWREDYNNWDYRDIEGEYPILTNVDIGGGETAPVYTIPGSVMAKTFSNYTWGDNLTWEPNTNYYVIKNANGLYASIPSNSYLSQQIDEWKLRVNDWNTQYSTPYWEQRFNSNIDTDALLQTLYQYQHPQPTPPVFTELAQLKQDYRTDYERLANRNQFEYNNWLTDYNKWKTLESTVLDKVTTPFLLSKHAGAAMKTAEDIDDVINAPITDVIATYVKELFDENNAGLFNTKEGRMYSKYHPYMSLFLNTSTDMLGPKAFKSTMGKPLRYMADRPKYIELTPDANGNITMYHGSPNSNITEFRIDQIGNNGFTDGAYFTDARQAAGYKGTFGNGKIYEVEYPYSQRNVVTIDGQGKKWGSIPEQNVADAFGLSTDEVYNIIGDAANDGLSLKPKVRKYNANQIAKLGRHQGVDAVHIKNVLDRGRRPFRLDRPLDLLIVYNSKDVMPKRSYNSFREIGKDLKESNRTLDLETPTLEQPVFTYDPILGYRYTGFKLPTEFGPTFNTPIRISVGSGPNKPTFKEKLENTLNRYFFIENKDSYTRGIGMGTEGIEDAFKTGVFRGNPRGTELNAKQFTKAFEKNKANFRDVVKDTGIKGIESKFQSRTLTEEEFNALKRSAKNIKKKENIPTDEISNDISLLRIDPDRLHAYDTYADYIADVNKTIAKVEEMPTRIASGEIEVNPNQIGYKTEEGITLPTYRPIEERFSTNSDYVADGYPLSYWYGDGRNPITKGHSYARSNYGVRVNNPETYTPFFHYLHDHPSFLITPKLMDPSVELFGKGPFGITLKLDKTTGKPLIEEDLKKLFKRKKGKRK